MTRFGYLVIVVLAVAVAGCKRRNALKGDGSVDTSGDMSGMGSVGAAGQGGGGGASGNGGGGHDAGETDAVLGDASIADGPVDAGSADGGGADLATGGDRFDAADAIADTGAPADAVPDEAPDSGGEGCGGAGELCCAGNRCRGGGCCVPRARTRGNYCVAPEDTCETGGTCQAGSCGTCGGIGQPCCSTSCTATGARCDFSTSPWMCVACGRMGQTCCPGQPGYPPTCTEPGLGCGAGDICAPCGAEGLACCDGVNDCPSGTACSGGRKCERCGGIGQICCGDRCVSEAACDIASVLCTHCGELGELCCEGQTCTAASSICSPLEPQDPVNQPALCRACGEAGQPCCAGRSCRSPRTCSGVDLGVCR